MGTKDIEQMPSQTALFVALRRAMAYRDYANEKLGPDRLAEIFLPAYFRFFLKFKKVRENTKKKLGGFFPGMTEYVIARTAFFDELFIDALKNRIPQIVLLGAGYDSRAYRFANLNRGTAIFELDAAPTQQRKIKCLIAAHIDVPQSIHHVPVNFMQESLDTVLEKAGYNHQERTLFLWEGVSYYLDRDSVVKTLDFVSRSSPRDSLIAFDYAVPVTEENAGETYGASVFSQSMKEHHANEAFLFSIRDEQIELFLVENKLRMIDHLDNLEIEQKYLVDDLGTPIGRMTGVFRFVCASPVGE